jgi:hypothetical protein
VTLTGSSVSVTPGTVTLVIGAAPVTPAPVAVTVTPGTLILVGGAFSTEDGDWHAVVDDLRWQARIGDERWRARL